MKDNKKKQSGSVFVNLLNAFSAFLYTLISGRCGQYRGLGDKDAYHNSRTAEFLEKNVGYRSQKSTDVIERFLEKSIALRVAGAFRSFMASLCLNVYGIFAVVYGLTSVVMYYLFYTLNGKNDHGVSALATAVILIVCAIPMLVGNRSVLTILYESVIMRKVLLSFLGIPAEKLKAGKSLGGTEYMFMAAILGLLFGIFTYFFHTAYFLIIFGVIVLISLISSHPEAGVVITVAVVPFLQYSNAADMILCILIVLTMISYVSKLLKRRRTASISAESLLVMIFCCFILVASFFSVGGQQTHLEGIATVIVIIGGFFMTYNLMESENRLSSCMKILTVAFLSICFAGIWNLIYNGIADGVIYSMQESVRPIFANNIIYIADDASVFGVFAVLISPFIFSYIAKRKSVTGVVLGLIGLATAVIASFIYGTYETIIAIAIEFCLFWLIYNHKSLTVFICLAIPMTAVVLAYPYLASRFNLPDVGSLIRAALPLGFSDSAVHESVTNSTLEMLKDGNWIGIGSGKHAFGAVYPAYSNAVSAGATNPGSLWLQVICWSGVGGLIAFVLILLQLFKNVLHSLLFSRDAKRRTETLGLFIGVVAALIFGCVTCIWDNIRMLYLFWVCVGLLTSYVREENRIEKRKLALFETESDSTDIELRF